VFCQCGAALFQEGRKGRSYVPQEFFSGYEVSEIDAEN
jgi:hypothetical protein